MTDEPNEGTANPAPDQPVLHIPEQRARIAFLMLADRAEVLLGKLYMLHRSSTVIHDTPCAQEVP